VPATSDVTIVGAGAVGVTLALELAMRGASVTLVERGAGPGAGCSAGNAGILGATHVLPLAVPEAVWEGLRHLLRRQSPFALRPRPRAVPWLARFVVAAARSRDGSAAQVMRALANESLARHHDLAKRFDTGIVERGFLSVYETPEAFNRALDHLADPAAPRQELLDAASVRERCPQLRQEPSGVIFAPDDPHCDPLRFVTMLAQAAVALGVEIVTGVEVLGLRLGGGRVHAIATTAGDLAVGRLVLAAGAWTARLAAGLPVAVPVQGGKGYHIDLAADGGPEVKAPMYFPERRIVATPLDGRLRLSGMLQLAGTDLRIDRRRVDAIADQANRLLTGIAQRPVLEVWSGLRPCSPDGLPIVGPVRGVENAFVATGHGMWGLQLAPATARVAADAIEGREPDELAHAMRPERFRGALR
jgi:D-amino-acid dehydrogenase